MDWLRNLEDDRFWIGDFLRIDVEYRGFAVGWAFLRKCSGFRFMVVLGPVSFMFV
jgi:hypothetical protein